MFLRSNFLHNCYSCTAIILVLVLLANGDVVNGDCNVHDFADKIFRGALNHRRVVIVLAALLFIVSVLCIPNVKINYQFSDYLPESSESTVSLRVMEEAFNSPTPNSNIMVEGLSLTQASELATQMETIEGVEEVMWLGTTCDISQPLETYDPDVVSAYKKRGFIPVSGGARYFKWLRNPWILFVKQQNEVGAN